VNTNPRLSIVSTLFRSAGTIAEFVQRSAEAAKQMVGSDYEIVIVDDGSPDSSMEILRNLVPSHPELVIIELSRNFGHHPALLEGMRQSRGELVFLIDSDLEEEPEWLATFSEQMRNTQSDVVYGYQANRKGRLFERFSGALYWKAFRYLSGLDIPNNIITCRLMTRQYVDAVLQFKEREVSIGGLFSLAGFKQCPLSVDKGCKGESSYSARLKIWHLINSVTAFSTKPLEIIFVVGLMVTVIGFVLVAYLLLAAIAWNQPPVGWTSVMASLWLIGGIVILSLGTVSIYLGKVFLEVKGRPRALERVRGTHSIE
jgi:putative glycosyltransferase